MWPKPAPSPEIFQSQEAAFIEHYDWLLRWALRFTRNNREHAKDLVQQVFCQFALAQTDLSAVQNLPAYLYTTLRNTHLSEVRLAERSHSEPLSVVEYSIADAALGAGDPYALVQTQDQLRQVCQYACLRKQSSRCGSVLILRFFHSYHISEIAAVLGGSCQAVRQSLKFARNEARLYLEDPDTLKFIDRTQRTRAPFTGTVCVADELLAELRSAIFCSCEGECLDGDSLSTLYTDGHIVMADNSTLAHIVSCAKCLDAVNRKLGLPLLAERHPADALGPNNNWRGGPGPSGPSGRADDSFQSRRRTGSQKQGINDSTLLKFRRRATELFEHHPRELCVSVNGHVLGSQSVNSNTSRLRLDVAMTEPLNFIEVLGDERTRLLVMTIDPPPEGEPTQERRVLLSEGRYIEASFREGHPWPMLEVIYHDPNFTNEIAVPEITSLQLESPRREKPVALFDFFRDLKRPFWMRPGLVSAIVSIVLISVLLFLWVNVAPTVTAANLISRARALESLPAGSEQAVHRVFDLEQHRHSKGEIVSRIRIETWLSGNSGASARRVYDNHGRLIAGEWANHSQAGGKYLRRIFRRDRPQQIETRERSAQEAIRVHEFWNVDPSARDYAEVVENLEAARVKETSDTYAIEYKSGNTGAGLLQATLTLRKSDLHPIAQILIINDGSETYEYRFTEVSFGQLQPRSVKPGTFEPDEELISKNLDRGKATKREIESSNEPVPVTATAALEVEVAYALDRFRTRFGDQLSLTKTPAGLLELKGVVDNEETRNELLSALSQFRNHPAVKIDISTVAEVLARQRKQSQSTVQEFAGSDAAIPVYYELRKHFAQQAGPGITDDRLDQMARDFATRVVVHSRRAVGHALELKQLASRFSDQELNDLDPGTRAKWFSLVRNHAEALRREIANLRGQLQPIFFNENTARETTGLEVSSDASIRIAVERACKLVLATDEAVRAAFAASSEASTVQIVRSARFQTELATSEKLAGRIRQAVTNE